MMHDFYKGMALRRVDSESHPPGGLFLLPLAASLIFSAVNKSLSENTASIIIVGYRNSLLCNMGECENSYFNAISSALDCIVFLCSARDKF